MTKRIRTLIKISLTLAAVMTIGGGLETARAQSASALRDYEPVLIEGIRLGVWVDNKDLTKLGAFKYSASSQTFTAIPFQIDKKRKINLRYNVNDPNSTVGSVNVCEYGYFRELGVTAGSSGDNFASNLLRFTDELVLLWKDAGDQAPRYTWLSDSGVNLERYEVILTDSNAGTSRFVYVFLWDSGSPSLSAMKYVNSLLSKLGIDPKDPPEDKRTGLLS